MKLTRTSGHLGLLTLALVTSPLTMAQPLAAGWYGGLGVGPSRSNIDDTRITSSLLGAGLTAATIDEKNNDIGYKLYGGYQFGRYFSVEGGYFDLGRFGFSTTTTPAGTLSGDIRLKGVNLDAVGRIPFTDKFSAIGRVGLTYVDTADQFRSSGAVTVTEPNPNKRDGGYKVGVGLQYEISQALALRLEAERYRINDGVGNRGDIDLLTVGLVFRFGGKQPEPAAAAPAPAPVAVAAQPQPVPAPVPVPPPRVIKRVVIAVDNDFDFDKVSLSASGKRTLDGFAKDLKGLSYERITVIGNTDRIGTESYNMKLSERRAEAVKSYLVLAGGLPASKVVATGAGESDHRTIPSDCIGERATAKLIECLQPDRRVDVEVHGSR